MPLSEFNLIERYFSQLTRPRPDVVLGIGDDCALLQVPPGKLLAVSIDTLVEGRHFAPHVDPRALGHKALAVNLSDLAAMGATPAWATLALTLPAADPGWLAAFARGFAEIAQNYAVQLVGGDTTSGPLSISIQVHGFVEPDKALRRDGAKAGDLIYVTGQLGDAALALKQKHPSLQRKLDWPEPRLEQGQALVGLASAAIDISDGLLGDLGHICERSGCGAQLHLDQMPISELVASYIQQSGDWNPVLAGGDDYELCVCIPPAQAPQAESIFHQHGWPLTRIGRITRASGLQVLDANGNEHKTTSLGFDHFAK